MISHVSWKVWIVGGGCWDEVGVVDTCADQNPQSHRLDPTLWVIGPVVNSDAGCMCGASSCCCWRVERMEQKDLSSSNGIVIEVLLLKTKLYWWLMMSSLNRVMWRLGNWI